MTPSQRTTLSFLDLALIMTGVMAMIASVGDRHPQVAEAMADSFGASTAPAAHVTTLPLARLFEPDEARLTDAGISAIAKLAAGAGSAEISINVPVVAGDGGSRLDRWELAAARTAAIMRVLADNGIAAGDMAPDLSRPGGSSTARTSEAQLTVRPKPAAQ